MVINAARGSVYAGGEAIDRVPGLKRWLAQQT
jgi:hypothetical protein